MSITIIRHVFTQKAPNVAKYGTPAPRDGYVNTFPEEIPEPESPEEWEDLEAWLDAEREEAEAKLSAWLGGGS